MRFYIALFHHELLHFFSSILSGGITLLLFYRFKVSKISILVVFSSALIGGFFIDLDHLIDYIATYGFHFNLNCFLHGCQYLATKHVYIIFHGWELIVVLAVIAGLLLKKKPRDSKRTLLVLALVSFTTGLLAHLIIDSITNEIALFGYSFFYRLFNNFELEKFTKPHYDIYQFIK